ncbi:MAG: hypothetical protein IJR46_00590 [Neisseriaceae bacterium]|nr:hypothetical protein [Neisseriaceae bacterium]
MNIQAAFNGVFGECVTIYAVVIENKLVIAKKGVFTIEKIMPDIIFITNNELLDADYYFREKDFQAGLKAYQYLFSTKQCIIQNDIAQFKIENVIDFDGQKENGEEKYKIQLLNNGHWAILALCWFFYNVVLLNTRKLEKIGSVIDELTKNYDDNRPQDDFFMTI